MINYSSSPRCLVPHTCLERGQTRGSDDLESTSQNPGNALDNPLRGQSDLAMAYVAVVKSLYDYAAQDPETELSMQEDQVLYVIEKEDDE